MGRFDDLINLDDKKSQKKLNTDAIKSELEGAGKERLEGPAFFPQGNNAVEKKPANLQDRKQATPSLPSNEGERPEKYTTRLEPSLVKKIRLDAIEKDVKDYEIVRTALNQYFARNK